MSEEVEQRMTLRRTAVESSERGAQALADAYWDEIRRLTHGLIRARQAEKGVDVVLAGTLPLLRFGPPEKTATADLVRCRFPITGGALAKRSGGSLSLVQRSTPTPELVVAVEDYAPRLDSGHARRGLRTLAYRHLQQPAHAAIGRRYLERMAGRES